MEIPLETNILDFANSNILTSNVMNTSNTINHEPIMKSYIEYKRILRDVLLTQTDKYFIADILKDPVKQQQITEYRETLRNYCNILEKIQDPFTLYSCNLPIPPFNIKLQESVKQSYDFTSISNYI